MSKNNSKSFVLVSAITAFFMTLVLFWDYYVLKTDISSPVWIFIKALTIGSYIIMALRAHVTQRVPDWFVDVYAILFYVYSWYGMAYIDMTYSFSFAEAFFIVALAMRQSDLRFITVAAIGLGLSILGHFMASEPSFVAAGESYKPHSFTITFLFFAISVTTHFIQTRYQRKLNELNEKFALIGKQSSFLMHEIKTPLNRVVANSETGHTDAIMNDIRRDSQKISALVTSIETLIHHPDQIFKTFITFDLSEIQDTLKQDFHSYLGSMNIHYDFNDLNGKFYGNKHLLYQLMKNTIVNAIEAIGFRKDETSEIKITMIRSGKTATISITNTNSQIPAKDLGRIFEPHYTTKKNGSNKGLGLALALSIVESHRGSIKAISQNNVTSFEITLPDYSEALEPA